MFSSYQPGYWGAAAGLTIRKSPQKLHRQKQGKRSRRRGLSFLYPLLAIMFGERGQGPTTGVAQSF